MRHRNIKKFNRVRKTSAKWVIFGLVMGVVLATVGSVGALNGWFGGGGTIPEDTMTRGLVGYWPMEEGSGTLAYDSSDYTNHGTTSGGPQWTKGKVGGALQFDGTNDYVNAGDINALDGLTRLTVAMWVKWNGTVGGITSPKHLFSKDSIVGLGGGWDANKAKFWVNDGGWKNSGASLTSIDDGNWHFIVGVYDGTFIRIYINGVDENRTDVGSITLASNANPVYIGIYQGATEQWNGLIDEVRVYNRALSASEVRYHYNRGGPVAHWKFDEGEGRTVYDSTENNNDGTLVLAGSATSSAWVAGKYGGALSFDGVDDYVNAGSSSSLKMTDEITVEAWAKRGVIGADHAIASRYDYLKNERVWLLYVGADNQFYFQTRTSAQVASTVISTNTPIDTNWHHYVGTYKYVTSGTSQMRLYLDGRLIDSIDTGTGPMYGGAAVDASIGRLEGNDATVDPFNGLIDDVRIYNYARTPEEIRLDYNAGFAAIFGPKSDCKSDPGSCMTEGLVGYWSMEESSGGVAYDSSNYANNGTLQWMSTSTNAWTKGKVGGALSFDGTDDYVDIGNPDALNSFGNKITLEAWVKTSGTEEVIVGKSYSNLHNSPYYKWLLLVADTGAIHFRIDSSAYTASIPVNNNIWHHVVGTYDGITMRVYVDGVADSTLARTADIEAGTRNVRIGARHTDTMAEYMNGLIDEVRIYNRALSADEVRYHYNRGAPVGHWKFDEGEGRTAYDSTDNNNDGTLVLAGSATSSAWVAGKYGSALSFDGTDDYVNAGSGASLNPTNALTISVWFKADSVATPAKTIIGRNSITGVPYGYFMQISDTASGSIEFGGGNSAGNPIYIIVTSVLTANTWYHAVGTYDGSKIHLYLNGNEIGTPLTVDSLYQNSYNTYMGKYRASGNQYFFPGLIDDVRIYNYARTPEEIRLDYNAGFAAHFGPKSDCDSDPGSCMTQGLVGYWPMEEGSDTIVYDSSNYANNGTLTSGPTWTKGKVGGALNFDGTDDYVNTVSTASFGLTNAVTVEAWVKEYNNGLTHQMVIGQSSGYIIGLGSGWTAGKFRFWVNTVTNGWASSGDSTTSLTYGVWYYLVGIYDGSTINLYVNGALETTGTQSGNISSGVASIGYDVTAPSGGNLEGIIDEVRIYNRALSAEEIRYHYNRGGPVAHWKFDEGEGRTAYDSTDNNNDGTLVLAGSATSSAWVAGKYGSALSFDGVNDYVDAGNSAVFNTGAQVTVEAWVKVIGDGVSNGIIVIKQNPTGATGASYSLVYLVADDKFNFSIRTDNTAWADYPSALTPLLNTWYHLVATYTSGSLKIYINGALDNTYTTPTGNLYASTGSLLIGREDAWIQEQFNGLIDDVRIYNYVRTPAQIQQDYNAGLSTHFR